MIQEFDHAIIGLFHPSAGHSWLTSYALYCVSDNNLLKGGIFLSLFWFLWFRRSPAPDQARSAILASLAGALLAIGLNKACESIFPFRVRPYAAGVPGVHFPFDMGLPEESSFPSDHAALFLALATGLYLVSRRIGIAAFFYAIVVICLPRIYLGLHYPSDLIAGGLIGVFSVLVANMGRIKNAIASPLLSLAEKYPGQFYCCFFLVTLQLASLFDDSRALASLFKTLIGH